MTAPTDDRIRELREIVSDMLEAWKTGGFYNNPPDTATDLLAALDELEKVKEENERLKKENKQMRDSTAKEVVCCRCGKETLFYTIAPYGSANDGDPICAECLDGGPQDWKARAEKAEKDVVMFKDFLGLMTKRANNAEAELEAQRPLIEAAMGADTRTLRLDVQTIGETWAEGESGGTVILRAALALRQRKEKGEGG
jgi:hypothetical protein